MCLVGVVVRRYIHFLILLIPTPLVSAIFGSSIPTFLFIFVNVFHSCFCPFFCNLCNFLRSINTCYSRSWCIYIHVPV